MSHKHHVKLKDRHMRKDKPRTPKQERKNEANTVKESKQEAEATQEVTR